MKDLWGRMLAGDEEADREWMHEAEMLVEQFRETRALFLTSRVSTITRRCPHIRMGADYFVSMPGLLMIPKSFPNVPSSCSRLVSGLVLRLARW